MTHPYLELLRDRPIRLLWIGLATSAVGNAVYGVAAIWLAVQAAGGKASLLPAAQSAAILAASLFGGPVAELMSRRVLLVGAELVRAAVCAAVVGAALAFGLSLPVLIACSVVLAALGALAHPTLMSAIPGLAPAQGLRREVNGLIDATFRTGEVTGPFLAVALLGLLPALHLITLNAASFLASAAALAVLGARLDRAAEPLQPARAGLLRRLGRGVSAASRAPAGWAILVATSVRGAGYMLGFRVGVPLVASQQAAGLQTVAWVFGAAAAGELLGNASFVTVRPRRPLLWLFGGYGLIGAGLALLGAASVLPEPVRAPAMILLAFVVGLGGAVGLQMVTHFGSHLEADDFAAVLRLRQAMVITAAMLTTAAGPWMFAVLGAPVVVVACGLAGMATAIVAGSVAIRTRP